MATSSDFLSEDQFQCSICLDVFTEPVSTPCGHTFCKVCLTRHWTGKQEYQCPLCNSKFNKDLKLSVNTTFREVLEGFKKRVTADASSLVKPWEVSCDICSENKFRASKTCLVCLTSFCDKHLEPHLRVAALQRHKLSEPVPDLEEKICREHNQIFEFFCLNDHIHFCVLCTDHIDHDKVNINEAYVDQRSYIWRGKEKIQGSKNKKNGKVQNKKKAKSGRAQSMKPSQIIDPNGLPYDRKAPNHLDRCKSNCQNQNFSKVTEVHEFQVSGNVGLDLAVFRESDFRMLPFLQNWERYCILRFTFKRNTQRVLLLVNYGHGLVLIFDPDNEIILHQFTGSGINEQVFPLYIPSIRGFMKWRQSLRSQVKKMLSDLNVLYWFGCFFIITLLSIYILHYLLIGPD
ncbi:PREDICTED: E3 ubiquitin/ISG15 ligase TRIM25-like [Cyprinodon variegatus]|uniref:E3 ubiquitin/ISG15 ligase TRIM25-like n=1 Tax=Cyprinodon variegatus TaxID=28743 RepID=A0A3Q2DW42_CYPVA|nr:PREDICTED: E3 ubiquitin/ISG15 ligase TRIM25-like [Cyprinodon variegatus]XP_015229691.1 PREDICTED: E3 ubiquitin/ISG15 ligase TRIM25-like [Cyprinodon variegatus]